MEKRPMKINWHNLYRYSIISCLVIFWIFVLSRITNLQIIEWLGIIFAYFLTKEILKKVNNDAKEKSTTNTIDISGWSLRKKTLFAVLMCSITLVPILAFFVFIVYLNR